MSATAKAFRSMARKTYNNRSALCGVSCSRTHPIGMEYNETNGYSLAPFTRQVAGSHLMPRQCAIEHLPLRLRDRVHRSLRVLPASAADRRLAVVVQQAASGDYPNHGQCISTRIAVSVAVVDAACKARPKMPGICATAPVASVAPES